MALCTGCGVCITLCPAGALSGEEGKPPQWKEDRCSFCDTCLQACPHSASPRIRWMDAREAAERVLVNRPFIRGITCSGGECTLYRDFLCELFALVKTAGLSCLIDTNGSLNFEEDLELLNLCDGVMLDIKALDNETHRRLTGADNASVLYNAEYLARRGKLTEIRTVVCAQDFGAEETVERMTSLLAPYLAKGNIRYRIIAFRPNGVREAYCGLGQPERVVLENLRTTALRNGFIDVIIT